MRYRLIWIGGLATLLLASLSSVQARDLTHDLPGSCDIPGIPRFADSVIIGYRHSQFDQTDIPTGPWDPTPDVRFWKDSLKLEGQRTRLVYLAPTDASALEVIRNYQQALEATDYQALFSCSGFRDCGAKIADFYVDERNGKKLTDNNMLKNVYSGASVQAPQVYVARHAGAEAAAYVFVFAAYQDNYVEPAAGDRVAVFVEQVLTKPMQDRMLVIEAAELASGLSDEGRIALYGITFDFDQATIRPESHAQLEEMANLLRTQPDLEVFIVGHTDNRGSLDYNMDLSRRRAEAVAAALADDYQIKRERLTPMGVANLAPVASNATEEGRAKNRRVELVQR
ncbi:OmpA family protein [Thiohalocapsa marina]|nr:OmpA family protein [Thiohalocapsa marina]